eukprot:TRINITY_DN3083_c0_g1_i3.p1 TRINITY_DN3083_c0_g1~~TRINITY_DN3083_c0_g1_i3.p1  ORF type:complete len:510 (+),score=63.13 TRINITY_DN3083_c0_g1_i3:124-1653(+)
MLQTCLLATALIALLAMVACDCGPACTHKVLRQTCGELHIARCCGDNQVQANYEECDDGNRVNGDGCSNCRIDEHFLCTGSPSVCYLHCGDNVYQPELQEQCDDGNDVNGDGCSDCRLDLGCSCNGSPSVCQCGLRPTARQIIPGTDQDGMKCHTGVPVVTQKIAYDGQDTIYVLMNCAIPGGVANGVTLAISRDKGATWGPDLLTAPFIAFGDMEESTSGSEVSIAAEGQYVHVVGHKPGGLLHYSRSTDRGNTWEAVRFVDDAETFESFSLNVITNGAYVYISAVKQNRPLSLFVSTDNGATFTFVLTNRPTPGVFQDLCMDPTTKALWFIEEGGGTTTSTDPRAAANTWDPIQALGFSVGPMDSAIGRSFLYSTGVNFGGVYRVPQNARGTFVSRKRSYSFVPVLMRWQLATDQDGNLYHVYNAASTQLRLDYWPYNTDDSVVSALGPAPGMSSPVLDSQSASAHIYAFRTLPVNNGIIIAATKSTSTTGDRSKVLGVWVEIVVFP